MSEPRVEYTVPDRASGPAREAIAALSRAKDDLNFEVSHAAFEAIVAVVSSAEPREPLSNRYEAFERFDEAVRRFHRALGQVLRHAPDPGAKAP